MVIALVFPLGAPRQRQSRLVVAVVSIATVVGVTVKSRHLLRVVFAGPVPVLRLLVL